MTHEDQQRRLSRIIAKAWLDKGFKDRLLSDAASTLRQEGVEIPPGVEVRIVEETDKVRYMALPPKPSSEELSDEQMADVAAGLVDAKCKCLCKGKGCNCACLIPPWCY